MVSDSEPESGTADEQKAEKLPASVSERPKKKKLRRPKPPIPKTEEEIDSPSKQTVGMLGILGLMTVIMWALARGGCNYHPPKETRTPRVVSTEDLARDPKNAAVELQQRWLTRNFAGAAELVSGDVAADLQRDKAACDATCLGARKSLSDTVLTSAVVLESNMMASNVRVTSLGLPGGPKVYLMRVERSEAIWKVTMRKADDGTALPALPTPPNPHELGGMLPLSSNGTPAASASGVASATPPAAGASASAAPHTSAAPHSPAAAPHPSVPAPAPASSKYGFFWLMVPRHGA